MFVVTNALGIGAASFASGVSKDIAESPTAKPERPSKLANDKWLMAKVLGLRFKVQGSMVQSSMVQGSMVQKNNS